MVPVSPVQQYKYFLTYRGFDLPLQLVEPLTEASLRNRNTYVRATLDANERLLVCEKVVYGEVEVKHVYEYYDNGALYKAHITVDDELSVVTFNPDGSRDAS